MPFGRLALVGLLGTQVEAVAVFLTVVVERKEFAHYAVVSFFQVGGNEKEVVCCVVEYQFCNVFAALCVLYEQVAYSTLLAGLVLNGV